MRELIDRRAAISWLIIVAATAISWVVGHDHGASAGIALALFGIAAAKVRLIGLDFMELRHAPTILRVGFEIHCIAIWLLLTGLYVWA